MKVARADKGFWVRSPLSSWNGQCSCRCSKPQASMQTSHHLVSPFLLWSRRAESLSCSTRQLKQHSPYSNHQRRCHRHSKDRRWNGSYLMKIRVGWSSMLPTTYRWSSMVQGLPCGSEGPWTSLQDYGWSSLLLVLYPSRNQQDVSRLEEEFLVDKNEEGNCEVCVGMWHVSKGQGRPFETS
jgi:hypothetical protein